MSNVAPPIVATLLPVRAKVTTRDVRMQLGPYRITDILGEGATGIVYRGVDPNNRELAIKVLREELALSDRERSRFLAEADRLRRVRHRALVEVVDAGMLPNGLPYIAMPFLHGTSLAERLQRGPLRFDVALHLFEQLADALQMLHREGLVHRDIKPENIFVTEGDGQAMLLDLGIARDVSSGPSTTTHAGMIRGTPAYMAPERFFGAPATPATDIYELGVVLYVTLVGALPWMRFDDPTERMRPATPASRGVILPPRLASTLMRALAASPGERPTSAHDFSSAVIEALSPESAHQISNQATAFVPSHMASQLAPRAPTSTGAAAPGAVNRADVFAATAMAPVGASGIRPATGPMAQQQMRMPPQPAPQFSPSAPKKKGPPALLIAAMTGASLLGVSALALALFVRNERSTLSRSPVAVATPSPVPAAPAEERAEVTAVTPGPASDAIARNVEPTLPRRPGARGSRVEPRAHTSPTGGSSATPVQAPGQAPATPPAASASAAPAKPLLPQPFPYGFPSSRMENCRTLSMYECTREVKAVIGHSDCAFSTSAMNVANTLDENSRTARDGTCRLKLVEYHRRFDAQQKPKPAP